MKPQNTLILTIEPFVGFRPDDVRAWLPESPNEARLAQIYPYIQHKLAYLDSDLYDEYDPWLEYAYEAWYELEQEIVKQMLAILQQEHALPDVEGYHWKIEPLMNRNGYYSSGGWWIEAKDESHSIRKDEQNGI